MNKEDLTDKENKILETCLTLCDEAGFFTIGNSHLAQLADIPHTRLNEYLGVLTEKGYLSPSVRFGGNNTYRRQVLNL